MARRPRPAAAGPARPAGPLGRLCRSLTRQGISVGPSETVDAGQVLSVLDMSDRETVREGLACAVLRRSDHRQTYDALFDLWWWPPSAGAPCSATSASPADGLDPQDVEAMRGDAVGPAHQQPGHRRPRRPPGGDDRPDRRGLRSLHLQSRPVVLVISGAQGDGTGSVGGRLLAGLLARTATTRHPHRSRSPKPLRRRRSPSYADWWRARPNGAPPNNSVATTSRCTASRSWPRTSSSCAPRVTSFAR